MVTKGVQLLTTTQDATPHRYNLIGCLNKAVSRNYRVLLIIQKFLSIAHFDHIRNQFYFFFRCFTVMPNAICLLFPSPSDGMKIILPRFI